MADSNLPVVSVEGDIGNVSFADDVIAIIAGLAAIEVPGVASMSGGIVEGIAEVLGRKNLTKGVRVEVGNEQAAVDLAMITEYGAKIPEVARNVQENVKKAIETMTGLHVVEVNIHVLGIRFEKDVVKEDLPVPTPRVK